MNDPESQHYLKTGYGWRRYLSHEPPSFLTGHTRLLVGLRAGLALPILLVLLYWLVLTTLRGADSFPGSHFAQPHTTAIVMYMHVGPLPVMCRVPPQHIHPWCL